MNCAPLRWKVFSNSYLLYIVIALFFVSSLNLVRDRLKGFYKISGGGATGLISIGGVEITEPGLIAYPTIALMGESTGTISEP